MFADCARILLDSEQIGGLLVVGLFGGYGLRFAEELRSIEEDAAHRMGKLVRESGKPIVLHSLYNFARPHALELLRYYGIPVFDSVDIACKCIASLSQYGHFLGTSHHWTNFVFDWGAAAKKEGLQILEKATMEGRHALLEHEAKRLLGLHGAPVSNDRLARTAKEAVLIGSNHRASPFGVFSSSHRGRTLLQERSKLFESHWSNQWLTSNHELRQLDSTYKGVQKALSIHQPADT